MRTLKRFVLFVIVAIICSVAWFYHHVNKDIQLPVIPYEFSIEQGNSLKNISQQLADAGILPNSWSFILLARLMGHESALKAGDYILNRHFSQVALLEYLIEGDIKQNESSF